MKKSKIALLCAAAVAALCVPAFSGCSVSVDYQLKTDEGGQKYYCVTASGYTNKLRGELKIDDYRGEGANRYPVKEIADKAFMNASITKVTIPATVELIGTAAFSYNYSLEEVVFEDGSGLKEIPWGAFAHCNNLTSLEVPSNVTVIDGLAFYDCSSLAEVTLPEGLEYIRLRAFEECRSLKEVELPGTLKAIGGAAFYDCTSLESIILPDSMRDYEVPAKDKDGKDTTETVPALGNIVFYNCINLKLAVVGEGITTLEGGVFGNCIGLETLYLPSTLTKIKGCYSEGSVIYGHPFYNVVSLKDVYFAGADWTVVEIDKTKVGANGMSNNDAIINAEVQCGVSYQK